MGSFLVDAVSEPGEDRRQDRERADDRDRHDGDRPTAKGREGRGAGEEHPRHGDRHGHARDEHRALPRSRAGCKRGLRLVPACSALRVPAANRTSSSRPRRRGRPAGPLRSPTDRAARSGSVGRAAQSPPPPSSPPGPAAPAPRPRRRSGRRMTSVIGTEVTSAFWKSSSNDSLSALPALASPNSSTRKSGWASPSAATVASGARPGPRP